MLAGGYNMCSTNSTSDTLGNIYDPGGPYGNYSNNQNCRFLINPGCNAGITLSFSSFNLENTYDFLYVFDGDTVSAPLLMVATGNTLPASVTAYSGKMLLVFTSDPSITYSGFAAFWTTVRIHSKPLANFNILS